MKKILQKINLLAYYDTQWKSYFTQQEYALKRELNMLV